MPAQFFLTAGRSPSACLAASDRRSRTPSPATFAAFCRETRLTTGSSTAIGAPYMHDGSLANLADVVNFYSDGGRANPSLDSDIRPLRFTDDEKRALIRFLESLSGRVREG